MLSKILGAVDHAQELDDTLDAVQVTQLTLHRGQAIEHHHLCRLVRLLGIEVTPYFTRDVLPLATRSMAGDKQQIPHTYRPDIIPCRGTWFRQSQSHL